MEKESIPAPGNPIIVLLLPIRTLAVPFIIPSTTTIPGAVLFSATAALNSARVDTIVMFPPEPPCVLLRCKRGQRLFALRGMDVEEMTYPPLRVA